MKFSSLLFAVLFSSTGFAANEGPQAAPELPAKTIAQSVTVSFFHPPGSPDTITVAVDAKGNVTYSEGFAGGRRNTIRQVAVLSAGTTAALKRAIAQIQPGELFDAHPTTPACMDAPTTTSQVFKASGERIDIAQHEACKNYDRKNANEADELVKSTLESLRTLAWLK